MRGLQRRGVTGDDEPSRDDGGGDGFDERIVKWFFHTTKGAALEFFKVEGLYRKFRKAYAFFRNKPMFFFIVKKKTNKANMGPSMKDGVGLAVHDSRLRPAQLVGGCLIAFLFLYFSIKN